MIEYDDGTVAFRRAGHVRNSFRVRVDEVTGFSETKDGRYPLERRLHLFGRGGELLSATVNTGHAVKIEAWFRDHPQFTGVIAGASSSTSLADELAKLAQLRDAGVLTGEEFEAQKQKLLG